MKLFTSYKILCFLVALATCTMLKAQFSVSKRAINMGDIELYSDIDALFNLKNKTNSPITITKVMTSNSLIDAQCNATTIAPNGTVTVTVKGKSPLAGRFTYAIYLFTDNRDKPYELYVKGRSILDVEAHNRFSTNRPKDNAFGVEFGNLTFSTDNIEFDYINDGDVVSKTIYITNNSEKNCEPNLMMLPRYLSVKSTPKILKPGRKGSLTVTLDSRKLDHRMGLTQNIVYASSYPGEKATKENAIPVSVVLFDTTKVIHSAKAPQLELSTTNMVLPQMKRRKVKGTLTLTNNGKSNLEIKSLQTFHPALNVSLPKTTILPGETVTLKVAMVKKYLDVSSASHRILMITNDYKKPVVLITVSNEH